MPEVAKVGAGLLLGGVGPKEESELLARDRTAPMQEEIRQQSLEARLVEAFDRFIVVKQAEGTKQTQMKERRHGMAHRDALAARVRNKIGATLESS
jgi:hypothetical protein